MVVRGLKRRRPQATGGSAKPEASARQPTLRKGYKGYCPLDDASAPTEVERVTLGGLEPEDFFRRFVLPRRPVIIEARSVPGGPLSALLGLPPEASRWALPGEEGVNAMAESPLGDIQVVAERRPSASVRFGQDDAGERCPTTLGAVSREIAAGSELWYLTTQPLPDGEDGSPSALAAPHVLALLRGAARLRPELLGKLALVQLNLWMGRSSEGSTTGLHHDFHDNIYVLIRGEKEFRLFSPRCVDLLSVAGAERTRPRLHSNGLIAYAAGLRDDGAPEAVVRSWRKRRGASADATGDSDGDEEELEAALDAADRRRRRTKGKAPAENKRLPDSFCRVSTVDDSSADPVPTLLKERHLTARMSPGDLLYLPASWFHEVISRGGEAGGHLALNFWMAPPSCGATFERPYADDFWEEKFQALQRAAREAAA